MNSRILKITLLVLSCGIIGGLIVVALSSRQDNPGINIATTNFVGYDFSRAVVRDSSSLSLLIEPGSDLHHYEPTPEDIISPD